MIGYYIYARSTAPTPSELMSNTRDKIFHGEVVHPSVGAAKTPSVEDLRYRNDPYREDKDAVAETLKELQSKQQPDELLMKTRNYFK